MVRWGPVHYEVRSFESWGCYLQIDLRLGAIQCGTAVTRLRVPDSRGRQRRRDLLSSPGFGRFTTGSPASGPYLPLCSIVEDPVTAPRPKRSGGGADRHLDRGRAIEHAAHAATTSSARRLLYNGSYLSPLIHRRCSSTDSFRVTAVVARFFARLPPRAAIFSPCRRRSQSSP